MTDEMLELIPNPVFVPEFGGYIAYKGVKDKKYYFVKEERYMGIPIQDMESAIPLMQRCDVAFRNGEPIPKMVDEYLF